MILAAGAGHVHRAGPECPRRLAGRHVDHAGCRDPPVGGCRSDGRTRGAARGGNAQAAATGGVPIAFAPAGGSRSGGAADDAVVFGGGVGEHEPSLRARCTAGFGWLGMELDRRVNESSRSEETRVSTARSQIGTWVMPVEEPRLAAADGAPLVQEEFKPDPQRHIGGSLSLVPAHAGSLLANGISAKTRAWRMGQTRRQPSHRHLRQCFNEIEPRGTRKGRRSQVIVKEPLARIFARGGA